MDRQAQDSPDPKAAMGCGQEKALPAGWRKVLMGFTLASLCFAIAILVFLGGLQATPWETTDSMGRAMGFNDPFHVEHYGIIWGNASVSRTLGQIGPYEVFFLLTHGLAMALICSRLPRIAWLGFFSIQPLLFHWGFLGLFVAAEFLSVVIGGRLMDREGYTDVPFFWFMGHGAWLLVVGTALVGLVCFSRPSGEAS